MTCVTCVKVDKDLARVGAEQASKAKELAAAKQDIAQREKALAAAQGAGGGQGEGEEERLKAAMGAAVGAAEEAKATLAAQVQTLTAIFKFKRVAYSLPRSVLWW